MHAQSGVLRLGVVPLTDAAPLLAAEQLGLFTRHGLRVALETVQSGATLHDKVEFGRLYGAQMLSPMPIAATLGLAGLVEPMVVAATLSVNGDTITFGDALMAEIAAAAPGLAMLRPLPTRGLSAALAVRRAMLREPPVLAVVFPFSTHNYLLREWLAAGGIGGFCAGEPWGPRAVDLQVGQIVLNGADIWADHPEKVLGFSAEEAKRNPQRIGDVVAAVIEAATWLEQPGNWPEAARMLCARLLADVPVQVLESGLASIGFRRRGASFPQPEHGRFWLSQMRRWQHVPADAGEDVIGRIWRPDLWRLGAAQLGEVEPVHFDFPVLQSAGGVRA